MRFTQNFLLIVCCCFLFHTGLQGQVISTIAGNGTTGSSGDGGPATGAQLNTPQAICMDNAGNLYIADYANYVIRKVNPAGIISLFAGTGVRGFSGDGGPATAADIGLPLGICIDKNGNIYFSDAQYHVIRKINTAGIISTIAGTPNVFGFSGDGGPATSAVMFSPSGICVDDAGNVYEAEFGSQVVRKISTTGIITTVAGQGTVLGYAGDGGPATNAMINSPTDVKIDKDGNLYIADVGNSVIRKVDAAGNISTFAGGAGIGYTGDGGPAASASLKYAYGVFVDANGNVYISDTGNSVVRMVDNTGTITTIAGNGTLGYSGDNGLPTDAALMSPAGLLVDAGGNIYIVDGGANVIRKIGVCTLPVILINPADQTICVSSNAFFFIKTAGNNLYQWQVNDGTGWIALNNDAVYGGATNDTLSITAAPNTLDGYKYRCLATSTCSIPSPEAVLNISSSAVPAIQIGTATDTICAGMSVIFTATATNTGSSPLYQWKKNGINIGGNAATIAINNLQNTDSISCQLTSSNTCLINPQALSNKVGIVVKTNLVPAISITASGNNVCAGTTVTFNAAITNGGNAPVYQWKKNAVAVGSNSSTYSDNNLANGDQVTCSLLSSENCTTVNPANSNVITMQIVALATPVLSISTPTPTVCDGGSLSFASETTFGGTAPVYKWIRNGVVLSNIASVYVGSFTGADVTISCILYSNARCRTTDSAVSNLVLVKINPNPAVQLDDNNTLCTGSSRQLDAGVFNFYTWNDGSQFRFLTISQTGTYSVSVIDANGCTGSDTITVSRLVPNPSHFLPADTAICSYEAITINPLQNYTSYLWNDGSSAAAINIKNPGVYTLQVIDANTCVGNDTINVITKACTVGFYIPNAFSPNNDGINDVFKPTIFGTLKSYRLSIYNRWGQLVFQTTDVHKGWDGSYNGKLQNGNGFIWQCSYFIEGALLENKHGHVMLIR